MKAKIKSFFGGKWRSSARRNVKQLFHRHVKGLPVLLAITAATPIASQATPERGMWIWESNDILQNTNNARATLFTFCAAPHGTQPISSTVGASQPVTTLYLYCHAYINGTATQKSQLRSFLSDAHAHGLKVQFLDGAPDWATTGKAYGESYLNYALQFNRASLYASQRFDGIQYDVEPYLNAGWFSQSMWNSFIGLLNDCENAVKASGQRIPFGVCIPRWYDSNPGASYLLQVQQATDYVAVMDYVDNTTSLINDASNEVANATRLGKKVILAVETMATTPTSVTFNEEGYGTMETDLKSLAANYAMSSGFAGTAIHHYTTYAALSEWGTSGAPVASIMTTGPIPVPATTSSANQNVAATARLKRNSN